jgi:diaminopimelate decarboxylase
MTAFASALRLRAVAERSDARLDGAVAVRRCTQYRKAFRWAAVSYPVDVLSLEAPSVWIRRHGVSVDVGDGDELETALSAGVDPLRVILHQTGPQATPACNVVSAGVGRVVVNSSTNVAVLAAAAWRRQRGLIPEHGSRGPSPVRSRPGPD